MKISIKTVVGENCITLEDGQKIYDVLQREISAGRNVELDFEGVRIFASPFFNAAIGQLLRDVEPSKLNALLQINGLSPAGLDTVRNVIQNSREYYASTKHQRAINKAVDSGTDN